VSAISLRLLFGISTPATRAKVHPPCPRGTKIKI
jgi:hypothetical protein